MTQAELVLYKNMTNVGFVYFVRFAKYPCCDDRRNRGGVLFGRNKMAMFIIESEINYFDPKK